MKQKLSIIAFIFSLMLAVTANTLGQWAQTGVISGSYVNSFAASEMNIFAATDSGVFLSTDNGTHWTISLPNKNATALMIKGPHFFAGTTEGIFLSIDNGKSWVQSNSSLSHT